MSKQNIQIGRWYVVWWHDDEHIVQVEAIHKLPKVGGFEYQCRHERGWDVLLYSHRDFIREALTDVLKGGI